MLDTTRIERGAATVHADDYLKIGDVADLTGLTQRAIRYYEELGLLQPATRSSGDIRLYSRADVRRLTQIDRMKKLLGFSLSEIKQIVEGEEALQQIRETYADDGDTATSLEKVSEAMALAHAHLSLLDRKMAQMMELRHEMLARLVRFEQRQRELRRELDEAGPVRLNG